MKMCRCVVAAMCVLCIALTPVMAKNHGEGQEKELIPESFVLEIVEKVLGQVRESIEHDFDDIGGAGIESLGRTVRLIFTVHPGEGKPCELIIMCATERYRVDADLSGENKAMELEISGTLNNVEEHEKLLLSYDVDLVLEDQVNTGTVTASGSAIIEFDTEHTLARLGEHTVMVEAELVE